MARSPTKPYHHGRLRDVVIEAALAEIETVGPARLSMRQIARRAGVSHAAPAHHFGDKTGVFTAIAIDGYRLLAGAGHRTASGSDALLDAGLAYVGFAISHRAHFEVMFRPDLYDNEAPELQAASAEAFAILFHAAEAGLADGSPDQVLSTAIAAWSVVHGFASLWLNNNFPSALTADPDRFAAQMIDGLAAVGTIASAQALAPRPSLRDYGIT